MKRKLAFAVIGGAIGGIALVGCIAATTTPDETPEKVVIVAPDVVTPTPTSTPAPIEIAEPETFGDDVPATPTAPVTEESKPAVTVPVGPTWAPRPKDTDRATGPVKDYDEGVLFCGVGAAPAIDQDPYGNWWAYCEPAMVNDDGTLWTGN